MERQAGPDDDFFVKCGILVPVVVFFVLYLFYVFLGPFCFPLWPLNLVISAYHKGSLLVQHFSRLQGVLEDRREQVECAGR